MSTEIITLAISIIATLLEGAVPAVAGRSADYGYLRLRREDYTPQDIERWTEFVRGQTDKWKDVFIYFRHEEAGIGPKLAKEMEKLLGV
jgi:uncharacterized protein YecE (DUF72 family)